MYDGVESSILSLSEKIIEQKLNDILHTFVTEETFKKAISLKLNYTDFKEYTQQQAIKTETVNKQFMLNEKFFDIRREFE